MAIGREIARQIPSTTKHPTRLCCTQLTLFQPLLMWYKTYILQYSLKGESKYALTDRSLKRYGKKLLIQVNCEMLKKVGLSSDVS